jgi:hypothetical protein
MHRKSSQDSSKFNWTNAVIDMLKQYVQIEGTPPLSLVNTKQDRKTRWGNGVYSPLLKATNKQWRRDIPMFNKL